MTTQVEDPALPAPPDPAKSKAAVWTPILVAIAVSVGSAVGWGYERFTQREKQREEQLAATLKENQRLLAEYLIKIQVTLEKTKTISDELNAQYLEPGWGILESYVIKATRDGHDKHALMYQRISRLVRHNAEIVSLLDGYEPYVISSKYREQAAEFRDHAQRYIDRFEALPKIVVTKQQLPVAKIFPAEFPSALQAEIAARNNLPPPKA